MFTECPLVHEPYPPDLLERSRRLLADVAAALRQHPLARPAAGRLRLFVPTDLLSADDHGRDDTSALDKLF
jgi:hypothetical protein